MHRREFIKASVVTGGLGLALSPAPTALTLETTGRESLEVPNPRGEAFRLPDLSPAQWLWYPSERTLPNTFVLFRREVTLRAKPAAAKGWITGDSRYRLEVNGTRIQWGPAPCDPRWFEADPIDLGAQLQAGPNALGVTVLFYGHGDGTWPFGRPGFLFWLELEYQDGAKEMIVSDQSWQTHLCRAWQPGWYKRWFLRALQERFDARLFPQGWSKPGFELSEGWIGAMTLEGSPNKPALSTKYREYLQDPRDGPPDSELRPRTIPTLAEPLVPVKRLAESMSVVWTRSSHEYFEFRGPDSFTIDREPCATERGNHWEVNLSSGAGALLTFEFEEQIVGFPYFTIDARAGTIVDLITQEGHVVGGAALLYTTRSYSWSRFVCREGENDFESFDYESLRWLQLHLEGRGIVRIRKVGTRRRLFPWKGKPVLRTHEASLQRLFNANLNTTLNAIIDQVVDGNGRERQQYGGEMSHQVRMSLLVFGDVRPAKRYYTTWSQGMTQEGYFLDGWPAYDRLARMAQVQLGVFHMGAVLDCAVQMIITVWQHYEITGDLSPAQEAYPRYVRFANFLLGLIDRDGDGLLPVLNMGVPFVWLDYEAYHQASGRTPDVTQRRKQCAWNLYVAHMFEQALGPMCEAFGDRPQATRLRKVARELLSRTVERFWSEAHGLFVDNLPWLAEEKTISTSDRAIAMAVLFDQCPGGRIIESISMLASCPPEMGFSHPENAQWRLWALAKGERIDVVLGELRHRWANLPSVVQNNTLQEAWDTRPDTASQWSHAGIVPISVAHLCLAGIRPLTPGFRRAEIWPRLGDIDGLELVAHTPLGPIHFKADGTRGARTLAISVPAGCAAEILLGQGERVPLKRLSVDEPSSYIRYALPSGETSSLHLSVT